MPEEVTYIYFSTCYFGEACDSAAQTSIPLIESLLVQIPWPMTKALNLQIPEGLDLLTG